MLISILSNTGIVGAIPYNWRQILDETIKLDRICNKSRKQTL